MYGEEDGLKANYRFAGLLGICGTPWPLGTLSTSRRSTDGGL